MSHDAMKAVIVRAYGGPEALRLERLSRPEPQAGQVRIAVSRAGLAFGDTLRRQGLAGARRPPFIPGYDVVGTIESLGPDVQGWKLGQRVGAYVEHGGYAEAVCAPAEALVAVPDRLSDATAVSLILNYGTAYQMIVHTAGLKAGQSLVTTSAAGGVGTAVLDLAKALNIRAVGLASSTKAKVVSALGATPIDSGAPDAVRQVRGALGGGADAVFDGIGGAHLWRSRAMAKRDGRVVLFGVAGVRTNGRKSPWGMMPTALALAAQRLFGAPDLHVYVSTDEQSRRRARYAADVRTVFDMASEGKLKPRVHGEVRLADVADAHRDLEAGRVTGKLVVAVA